MSINENKEPLGLRFDLAVTYDKMTLKELAKFYKYEMRVTDVQITSYNKYVFTLEISVLVNSFQNAIFLVEYKCNTINIYNPIKDVENIRYDTIMLIRYEKDYLHW